LFRKVLIAHRGEIAVRIIRACRELRIATVAVYSTADADCLHVRMADEAICIGPPANRESYLNIPAIITAALITGAQAIHPGYGNLSENPSFAENCEACKIKFIGPPAPVIERMGDKVAAKLAMKAAGVPVIPPETEMAIESEQQAMRLATKLGYPVMIKATAGGGGRGIRVVHNDEDLAASLPVARAEAEAAFGRPGLYLEKLLEEPRHVEVQILADGYGNMVHLGERDCSIQHRHQKLLEESPSPSVNPKLREALCQAALRGARAIGYVGVGTMEFLVDRDNRFYFMEANTRLQVEHPVTEMVTGVDLVAAQLRVAAGEKLGLGQKDIPRYGHAIECRITAQDPDQEFAPCGGKVESYLPPGGPGVRVDSHLYAGYVVPSFYDPLLAKLVVWGRDRREAVARTARALREMELVGIKTTIPFHRRVMANAFFRKGEVTVSFVARRMKV
jgi:acetyl-CoA carboxylase biotin carboxylase subunit